MPHHYLVTGGTGFLGAALVRRLIEAGHRVRVMDDNSRGAPRRLADLARDFEMLEGDVRDTQRVEAAARGTDGILHLAAVNGTEFFYSRPDIVLDVGIRGILNVVDACRRCDIGHLVVASSSEVYQTPPAVPTDEGVPLVVPDPLNPRYSYAGSKIISELVALNASSSALERISIFRPHNVYGPDMAWEHVIPQFCLRALRQCAEHPSGPLPFPIQGDGSQTRSFVHIDDMIDGLMLVIENGAHRQIYHVGNPEEIAIADVAHAVVAAFGRQAKLIASELPPGSTPRRCPDISKLRALGYVPRVPFAQGIGPVVAWYREHAHLREAA
jgi:nucleoside-diphosphate-sugar epimerase